MLWDSRVGFGFSSVRFRAQVLFVMQASGSEAWGFRVEGLWPAV